ncbi:MAG: TatD family hydrolase [Opitutales bacterium]|nr:TatD family hydrolase [Opitutales bacterium]MCH8541203.1 TatD family hydrolase [Opitutales bacterium]
MELIDSHTHLESFHQRGEIPEILERARENAVGEMVTVGTDPDDWDLYRSLAEQYAGQVHYTVGLHPCHVEADWEEALAKLPYFFTGAGKKPVALGETGLDRFHLPKEAEEAEKIFAWQKAAFERQIEWALEWGMPLVVHSRGAFGECLELLRTKGMTPEKTVFHCFSDGPEEMRALAAWGGRASFTGIFSYKSAENVRQAAAEQGWDQIMLETDAPYLAPVPHRGKRNEPGWVCHVAEAVAKYSGEPLETIAARSTAVTRRFYRLGESA